MKRHSVHARKRVFLAPNRNEIFRLKSAFGQVRRMFVFSCLQDRGLHAHPTS